MTYEEVVDYILAAPKFIKNGGIEHTGKLMELLGNPQDDFHYIHVAGTNGKGSVCAMLGNCLCECGERTGVFTSPHLVRLNERFVVDREMISDEALTLVFLEIKEKVDRYIELGGSSPSFFEWMYMIGMYWFKKAGVTWAVVETGLGGRLDATNVIGSPDLTVITSISFDHMHILGHTIKEIAAEKAGIIKAGVPVVYDAGDPDACSVIEKTAGKKGAFCIPVQSSCIQNVHQIEDGFIYQLNIENPLTVSGPMQLQISMAGTYQLINSALAAAAVQILYRQKYLKFPSDDPGKMPALKYIRDVIQAGLQKTFWPGRMEKIRDHVYIDGAHNEAGIRALTDTLTRRFRDEAIYLLFAVAEDKDYTTMIKTLCSMEGLAGVVVTSLDNERRTDIETVAGLFEKNGHASVIRSYNIKEAFDAAQAAAGTHVLCCCGSLYLAGSIKALN